VVYGAVNHEVDFLAEFSNRKHCESN